MKKQIKKLYLKKERRYRKKIIGTNTKPRLSIFRSNNYIYAQLIDDINGNTLVSSSSLDKNIYSNSISKSNVTALVGQNLARKALSKNIDTIVFDKGRYKFIGRIKSLVENARKPIFYEYIIVNNSQNKIITKKLNF